MKKYIAACFLFVCSVAAAQTFEVKDTLIRTYPYADPNPIPEPDGIYPYFKYENFAFEAKEQKWEMVVLENDYLRVKIFPQVGGKIWSVYDKKQGKEMFYDNKVMKFRDISLRGPWTSGGIEFNYGVIGHAPSCSFPVDYKVEKKTDGSVSCYIGVQELLTRTRWMVEINLPEDAAFLRTTSFWHNGSGMFQPYYTWTNSAVSASDDLELIYPGTYSIGHDGITSEYPFDEQGRDLSKYANQNFGIDKSFHPGGTHKGYFGAYWADDDFGVLHYALRDEKLGRKYFSWSQSDQGNIWIDLLTDTNPQYVELQSGRLFNQNLLESINTPFKQTVFSPFGTDRWNEYWLPFSQIGNIDDMSLSAAVTVRTSGKNVKLGVYPVRNLKAELTLKSANGEILFSRPVDMRATEAETFEIELENPEFLKEIYVGEKRIWTSDKQDIDRPHKINENFSLTDAQGYAIHGTYLFGMRKYGLAENQANLALESDPSLIPALNLKAMLCLRSRRFDEAYDYSGKVLAIDAYNPHANYISGLAAIEMGKVYDAMDRFEIAAITNDLRSAACLQLAKIHFVSGDRDLAAEYAEKSLAGNVYNISAYELLYQITGDEAILGRISSLDPLHHFSDAERVLSGSISSDAFDSGIKEEMKWQNYLELACFYNNLGLNDKALKIIEASKDKNILLELWKAYLKNDVAYIEIAENAELDRVFPFRGESVKVLEWAVANGGSWKSRYLLAMLEDFLGNKDKALSLVSENDSDYPTYYAYRCRLSGNKDDMAKAVQLEPEEWRYRNKLALMYYREGDYAAAVKTVEQYYARHKDNFYVGDSYIKSLIAAGEYSKADKVISNIRILPFEGQSGSHVMYRDIKQHLAVDCIDKGNYKKALGYIEASRQWPLELGVGKPYDDLIDNKMEDLLSAVVYARMGKMDMADSYLKKLPADGKFRSMYDSSMIKANGAYPKIAPMMGNLDASFDKKLF